MADPDRVAVPTAQDAPGPGHNGGPKLNLFGIGAAWLRFANELELRRLAILHVRIERKKASMRDLVAERQRIMNRCIRRMRRDQGKQ